MKNNVKINRNKWAEAGISRGYIGINDAGYLELRKEAMDPITASLLIGAGIYLGGEAIGAGWNALTGGRSWQEVMGGFKVTTESVAQYETGLIALEKEVAPLLKSATLNIQEAVMDAINQGRTTLELMEQELRSKGMAVPNVDVKQKREAVARKRREDQNYAILFEAAKKPVGGTRPGNPQTKKTDISPDDASAKTGEAGREILKEYETVKDTGKLPEPAAPAPSAPKAKATQPSGGRQLNPRMLGG